QVLLSSEDLAVEEILKLLNKAHHIGLVLVPELSNELKILFRSEISYQEAFVDKGRGERLPGLALAHGNLIVEDISRCGFYQVEQQTEERRLPCSVVPYKSKALATGNFKMIYIQNGCSAVLF